MNYTFSGSRTIWTIVAMFLIGGVNAIVQVFSPDVQAAIMFVLSVLASYFHVNPSQYYNQPQE